MKIRFPINSFFLLLLLFPHLVSLYAEQISAIETQKSRYLAEADSLKKIERYEESLISYFMAYELGLPRDSLYYFWAELFVKKGDLDSALAVNRSALEICNGVLRKELLRQRYSIYVILGADEAAMKISKELGEVPSAGKVWIKPSLNTGFYLKGEREKVFLSDSSYWLHSGSPQENIIDGLFGFYRLSTNVQVANLPARLPDFSVGTIFQLRKNTDISAMSVPSTFDSLSIEGGAFFRLDNLAERLGVELRSVYNFDSYRKERWIHGLAYSVMATDNLFSVGAYNLSLKKGKEYDYQQGFLSVILDLNSTTKVNFSPSLSFSFFLTRNDPFPDISVLSSVVYVDPSEVKPDQLPLFYTDAEKRNPLDTSGFIDGNLISRYSYIEKIKKGSTSITQYQPLSLFRIEPAINAVILFREKWTIKPGIRLGVDIYSDLYRWNEFDRNEITSYMALDPVDNSYYQITGTDVVNEKIRLGKKVGSSFSKRRLDTELQGSVSLGHTFRRAGNIIFSVQLNKFWTNLPTACPVEIREWSVAFVTDWQYSIDFRKKR
jgi:tetratricopeptide (TPR) repeat protein